jgi:hypothetical protein
MVNCDKVCDTCGYYNDPNSKYECQYWEGCVAESTCSEWIEGHHPHNILYRIRKLEESYNA